MTKLRVATYNIRMDAVEDGDWGWAARKEHVLDLITYQEWDLFGIQEALPHQLLDLKTLNDYTFIGTAREDGINNGEYNGVFYKKDRFECLEEKTFWLSETPDVPSIHPTAGCHRLCVLGLFQDKESGQRFVFGDTHLDHVSEEARELGAQLIIDYGLAAFKQYPTILVGDFNAEPTEAAYQLLTSKLDDSRYFDEVFTYGPNGTFNEFRYVCPWNDLVEIDYIFVSKTIKVKKVGTLTHSVDNKFPSDHFPVEALIEI